MQPPTNSSADTPDIPFWMSRTQLLLGDTVVQGLMNANVLVVGLGGVGGICAEMIARAGVGRMTIVDADTVDPSNRNRQIPALATTHYQLKAQVMAERLLAINPELQLTVVPEYLRDEKTPALLDANNFDYVADCIDTLSPKVFLLKACVDRGIPVASSMGAGGKVDPTQMRISDIAQTRNCTLARYVRKRLGVLGIRRGITVVWSPEEVDASRLIINDEPNPKKSVIGTISYMPALFGCSVASIVIRGLCQRHTNVISS